jgi:hypothetical protein
MSKYEAPLLPTPVHRLSGMVYMEHTALDFANMTLDFISPWDRFEPSIVFLKSKIVFAKSSVLFSI